MNNLNIKKLLSNEGETKCIIFYETSNSRVRNSCRLLAKADSIHKRSSWFEIERREKNRLNITLTTLTLI